MLRITTTITTAYAQETVTIGDREQAEIFINQVIDKLQNIVDNDTEIPRIYLHEEGGLTFFFDNGTARDFEDDWEIFADHNYTDERGYTYDDYTLFAPNGTALFS